MITINKIIVNGIAKPVRELTFEEKSTVIEVNSDPTGYVYYQIGDELTIIEEIEGEEIL